MQQIRSATQNTEIKGKREGMDKTAGCLLLRPLLRLLLVSVLAETHVLKDFTDTAITRQII